MNGERVEGLSTGAAQTMDLAHSPIYFAGLPKSFNTARYVEYQACKYFDRKINAFM